MSEDTIAAAASKLERAEQAGDGDRLEALQEVRTALEAELDRDLDQTSTARR